MARSPRYFRSGKPYAVTFRTCKGLPLVATYYMRLLLEGIVARTQRDFKVTICHFLWMANHPHFFVLCQDPAMLCAFYGEIQKSVTEAVKRLLGINKLNLWEGRAAVAEILDLDAAINQIAYIYGNPSRANLVSSIEEYPGFSTFHEFKHMPSSLFATAEIAAHWVRSSRIPTLPEFSMRQEKDRKFTSNLKKLSTTMTLVVKPNAWMNCFGIKTSAEVTEINEKIVAVMREKEIENAAKRKFERMTVVGERALRVRSILKTHTPASSERKIFVISSDKELRKSFIDNFIELCATCRECFIKSLRGLFCIWPPGMFRPPLRHVASCWDAA